MGIAPKDNLNNMEVWDKFDLSRIVIWNNVGWQMILVAEVTCVAKRLKFKDKVIYYITCPLCITYYFRIGYSLAYLLTIYIYIYLFNVYKFYKVTRAV